MRSYLKVGFALLVLTLATAAFADTIHFSYADGPEGLATVTAQGTLTGTLSKGVFTAASATGTYNDQSISLADLGTFSIWGNFGAGTASAFSYDNLVYVPEFAGSSVDWWGLAFHVEGSGDVNLYSDGYNYVNIFHNSDGNVSTYVNAWFGDVVPTSTPEPGTLVMFGSAMIGLGGVLRRKINL